MSGDAASHPARGLRTAVPAVVAVLVALGGHLAGGGMMASPFVLVALAAGAGALSYRLSAQRWSPRTLTALMLLTQAAVHLVCGLTAHGAAMVEPAGGPMLAGHLAATALAVAVLCRGEDLLAVVTHLLGLVGRVLALLDASVPGTVRTVVRAGRLTVLVEETGASWGRLRGPPVTAIVPQS